MPHKGGKEKTKKQKEKKNKSETHYRGEGLLLLKELYIYIKFAKKSNVTYKR